MHSRHALLFAMFLSLSVSRVTAADSTPAVDEFTIDLANEVAGTTMVHKVAPGSDVHVVLKNVLVGKPYKLADGRVVQTPASLPDACNEKPEYAAAIKNATSEKDVRSAAGKFPDVSKTCLAGTTIDVGRFQIAKDSDIPLTISRAGEKGATSTWSYELVASKPEDENAPAKTSDARLKELIDRLQKQPSLTVKRCEYASGCSDDPVYINSDQESMVYISGVPKGKRLTVRVSAGEHFKHCPVLDTYARQFWSSPDVIVIPLLLRTYVANSLLPGLNWQPVKDALDLYGIQKEQCHDDGLVIASDNPTIPLMLVGNSNLVDIELDFHDGDVKSFQVPLRYQLFWLDAGGFFAFGRTRESEVVKEPAGEGKVKVTAIRQHRDLSPATGIVMNVHPGNYPAIAVQFGIAANQDRSPNYYLGTAVRLREVGKRGLATFGVGIAAIQSTQFPGLKVSDQPIASDSPFLIPRQDYRFGPYFSITLGFSFGGVSESTNVAGAVGH